MQTAAKEALDISQETAATHQLYGIDKPETQVWGTRCLIARRLVERGVRFVQIPCGNQHWDHHGGIQKSLPLALPAKRPADRRPGEGPQAARPARHDARPLGRRDGPAAGRSKTRRTSAATTTPTASPSGWPAAASKRGYVHGATDEFGHKAVENVVNHYDYHATLLHLFGLEPSQAVFQRASGPGSLIDGQPARVVTELLA